MSGPKISVYTLKGRPREIFIEQTSCLRQSHICMEDVKSLLCDINILRSSLGNIRSDMQFIVEQTGEGGELLAELHRQEQQAARMASAMPTHMRLTIPATISQRDLTESTLAKRQKTLASLQSMQQETGASVAAFQNAVDACQEHSRAYTNRMYHTLVAGFEEERKDSGELFINTDPFSGVDFSVTVPELGAAKENKLDLEYLSSEISRSLQAIRQEPLLSEGYKAELETAEKKLEHIRDYRQLKAFHAITVHPLLRSCDENLRLRREQMAEYRQLHSRYLALCSFLQEYTVDIPFREGVLEELQERITILEKRLVTEKEQECISSCIDEVMVEMGCNLIGNRNVTKKSGKRFRNEIYTFSEGTALNITYASDGKIAMELGGLDHTDRIPIPEESDQLCDEMKAFCGDFAEIEKRLADKGVFLQNRISLSPPGPEYAAILNLDDYTMTTDQPVSIFSLTDRRHSITGQKTMRRDNE